MLFNSPEFIYAFLPIVLALYWLALKTKQAKICILVLAAASLVFYGYWNPIYLVLFLVSVAGNYFMSLRIFAAHEARSKGWLLTAGVLFNLGLLGYFKYAVFVVDNATLAIGASWQLDTILLPLAISFFTFQQIAYLVDCRKGEVAPPSASKYLLFISFFPQLIAGPIVHHYQMLPQFENLARKPDRLFLFLLGAAFFFAGLFKKVVLADSIAVYADTVFNEVLVSGAVAMTDAWIGTFAFGFQIYFDFSGYSDMAIGLALLFGIRLPLNFNSPYKATSIIDFWRRWHMTLSQFLRDQLYIPLGGNRHGAGRQLTNMMIVMLLGGLWHGAGWGFVLWGGLHGGFLIINHLWRRIAPRLRIPGRVSMVMTFLAVMFAWVPFRAETWDGTLAMWQAMAGLSGSTSMTVDPTVAGAALAILIAFVWLLPNTQNWLSYGDGGDGGDGAKELRSRLSWRPTSPWAIFNAATAVVALGFMIGRPDAQEFLYFQF